MVSEKEFKRKIFEKISKDEGLNNLVNSLDFKINYVDDDVLIIDKCNFDEELICLVINVDNNFIEFCGSIRSISIMVNDNVNEVVMRNFDDNYEMSLIISKRYDINKKGNESNNIHMRVCNNGKILSRKLIDMKICGEEVGYYCDDKYVIRNSNLGDGDVNQLIKKIICDDKSGYVKFFMQYAEIYNSCLGKLLENNKSVGKKLKK